MTTPSRFAGLDSHGRTKAEAEKPTDDIKPTDTPITPDPVDEPANEPVETPDEPDTPAPEPTAHGSVAAAVFASEESVGRERLAADFMAHSPTASADQVIAFLAKQPKVGANATDDADERDRRAGEQMLATSKAAGNADLGAGADSADVTLSASDRILAAQRKINGRDPA